MVRGFIFKAGDKSVLLNSHIFWDRPLLICYVPLQGGTMGGGLSMNKARGMH
jgi:hypothetical protein